MLVVSHILKIWKDFQKLLVCTQDKKPYSRDYTSGLPPWASGPTVLYVLDVSPIQHTWFK